MTELENLGFSSNLVSREEEFPGEKKYSIVSRAFERNKENVSKSIHIVTKELGNSLPYQKINGSNSDQFISSLSSPSSPTSSFRSFIATGDNLALQSSVIGQHNTHENGGMSMVKKEVRFLNEWKGVYKQQKSDGGVFNGGVVNGCVVHGGMVHGGRMDNGEKNKEEITEAGIKIKGNVSDTVIEERLELVRIPASQMVTERLLKSSMLEFKSLCARGSKSEKGDDVEEIVGADLEKMLHEFDESIKNSVHNKESFINSDIVITEREMNVEVNEMLKESVKCGHCGREEGEVQNVRKELKVLEGRIEAVQQKSQLLTSQNHQLTLKLKSNFNTDICNLSTEQLSQSEHCQQLTKRIEELLEKKRELEDVVLQANKLIHQKEEELEDLTCQSNQQQTTTQSLISQLTLLKQELVSKEVIVSEMKSKVSELYVETQTSKQGKLLLDNQSSHLSNQLKEVISAKDWYKDQLFACQQDKKDIQEEVSFLKMELISKSTTIHQLKAQSVRLKQNLTEMEQKLLEEKQFLASKLEDIETDLMEKEASFLQSNKQYFSLTSTPKKLPQHSGGESESGRGGYNEVGGGGSRDNESGGDGEEVRNGSIVEEERSRKVEKEFGVNIIDGFEIEKVGGLKNKAVEGLMIELLGNLKKSEADVSNKSVKGLVLSQGGGNLDNREMMVSEVNSSDEADIKLRVEKECKRLKNEMEEWKCKFANEQNEFEEKKKDCDRWKTEVEKIRRVAEERCTELVEWKRRVSGLEAENFEKGLSMKRLEEVVMMLKGEMERVKKEGGVDQKVLESFIQERDSLKIELSSAREELKTLKESSLKQKDSLLLAQSNLQAAKADLKKKNEEIGVLKKQCLETSGKLERLSTASTHSSRQNSLYLQKVPIEYSLMTAINITPSHQLQQTSLETPTLASTLSLNLHNQSSNIDNNSSNNPIQQITQLSEKEKSQMELENQDLKMRIEELNSELKEANKNVVEININVGELQQMLRETEDKASEWTLEKTRLSTKVFELEGVIVVLKGEIAANKNDLHFKTTSQTPCQTPIPQYSSLHSSLEGHTPCTHTGDDATCLNNSNNIDNNFNNNNFNNNNSNNNNSNNHNSNNNSNNSNSNNKNIEAHMKIKTTSTTTKSVKREERKNAGMKGHYEGLDVSDVFVHRQAGQQTTRFNSDTVQERNELRRRGEEGEVVKMGAVEDTNVLRLEQTHQSLILNKIDKDNDYLANQSANRGTVMESSVNELAGNELAVNELAVNELAVEDSAMKQYAIRNSEIDNQVYAIRNSKEVKLILKQRQDAKDSMNRLQLTNQRMLVQELNTKVMMLEDELGEIKHEREMEKLRCESVVAVERTQTTMTETQKTTMEKQTTTETQASAQISDATNQTNQVTRQHENISLVKKDELVNSHSQEINSMKEELFVLREDISRLRNEKGLLTVLREENQKSLMANDNELEDLKMKLRLVNEKNAEFERLKQTLEQENMMKFKEFDELKCQFVLVKEEKDGLMERLKGREDGLEGEVKKLRTELVRVVQLSQLEMQRYQQDVKRMEEDMRSVKIVMEREKVDIKLHYDLLVEKEKGKLEETIVIKERDILQGSQCERCTQQHNLNASKLALQEDAICKLKEEVVEMKAVVKKNEADLKESKKKLFSEKAACAELRREKVEMASKMKLLVVEVESSRNNLTTMSVILEELKISEGKLRQEREVLRASDMMRGQVTVQEAVSTEFEAREYALLQQIKWLEWKVSDGRKDLTAMEERISVLLEEHRCEVETLDAKFKLKCVEVQTTSNQLKDLVRERLEMKARIVQFKQAISDILIQHTQISTECTYNVLNINKVELHKLLDDDLSAQQHNKASGALKCTLKTLSEQIGSLRSQMDKHTFAAQSSSLAWKELGEQVIDLQEICRSSAANRASHGNKDTPTDPILLLPIEVSSLIRSSPDFSSN